MIDDFWSDEKSEIIGSIVYDAQGDPHTVEHDGVTRHTGDEGMRYIAEAVYASL